MESREVHRFTQKIIYHDSPLNAQGMSWYLIYSHSIVAGGFDVTS